LQLSFVDIQQVAEAVTEWICVFEGEAESRSFSANAACPFLCEQVGHSQCFCVRLTR
jgi:hypothetical protein